MARKSKGPRYWKPRKQWVVDIRGKRHYLGHDKTKANEAWHALMSAKPSPRIESDFVVAIFEKFLDWTQKNREQGTYDWYASRINEFARTIAELRVSDLKPFHLQEWIDSKRSSGHKRGCVIAVSRSFNWAVKQGHIDKNPVRGLDLPAAGRREVIIPETAYRKMVELSTDDEFRDLLTFSWETGCRPQEVFILAERHVDFSHQRCVFPELESKGKKKKRVIYLTEIATTILHRLIDRTPTGPLFRNADGEPWDRNQVACRFERLRQRMHGKIVLDPKMVKKFAAELKERKPNKKTKNGPVPKTNDDLMREARWKLRKKLAAADRYCLYHFRHTWMTRMLKAGVDPITVATLAGHNDVSMLARIYAHIQNDTEHLQKALQRIAPVAKP